MNKFKAMGPVVRAYRAVIIIGLSAFFIELGYSIINISTLPVYLTQELHAVRFLGVLLGTQEAFDTLSRPFLGALGDKIGRRYLVIIGPLFSAITAMITVHISLGFLFILRIIDGFAAGALWTSVFAETADITGLNNRNTAVGIVYVGYIGALAIGPLFGGLADHYFGHYFHKTGEAAFVLASIIFILGSGIAFFIFKSKKTKTILEIEKFYFSIKDILYSFQYYTRLIILAYLFFMSIGFLAPLAKVYAMQRYGITDLAFGYALAPVAAILGILSIPLAHLGDRVGIKKSIMFGSAVAAIAAGFLVWSRGIVPAAIESIFLGLGFIAIIPAWISFITKIAPKHHKGQVLGIIGFAEGFGALTGASLSGVLFSIRNFKINFLDIQALNLPFFCAFIVLCVTTVLIYFWIYRSEGSHRF